MLDDDGIGAHLDHEPAGVLDAGAGDKELIATVEEDDEIVELVAVSGDVADEVNQVKGVGAGEVFGGDGEFMLGDGENANPEATQVSDEDAAGSVKVWAGADGLDAGLGADRKGIRQAGGAVVEDVVIGQVKDIDAGLSDAVDAGTGFAEDGTGLSDRSGMVDEGAFEIDDGEVGLLKFREQVVQQGSDVTIQEMGLVALNRADVGGE
jgi:hypothetical protein